MSAWTWAWGCKDPRIDVLTSWTGFYYDGRTAGRARVTVVVTAGGLHLTREDGQGLLWPFAEIRRVNSLGNEDVRLERGESPAETLTVAAPGLPEAIAEYAPELRGKLGRWAGLHDPANQRTIIRIAVAAVALFLAYFVGVPLAATAVADRIPLSWEETLGGSVVDRIVPASRQCTDSAALAAVNAIVHRLLAAGPASRYTFRTRISSDTILNAFAAPGGYVVVNRGLLAASQTPDELAGVLAHEIEHVLQHHSTRAMIREIPLQFALSAIGGADAMAGAASRAAGTLSILRYRRADESEADREGMQLIQAARIDPRGMVDFFSTLAARDSSHPRIASYLSTHPQTIERMNSLRQMAEASQYTPHAFDFAADWASLRNACVKPE